MGNNFNIKKLINEDANKLKDLRQLALINDPTHIDEDEDEKNALVEFYEIKIQKNDFFGAFDNDKLVGISAVSYGRSKNHLHKAYIESTYILPEYRGKGLCGKLISKNIEVAKKTNGIEIIASDVILPNYFMHHLLTKNGFKKEFELDKVWKQGDKYLSYAYYRLMLK